MAARPTTRTVRLWRLRADLSLIRWLMSGVVVVGIVATVRQTIWPPQPRMAVARPVAAADLAAEGFAEQFARTLLTFDSSHPDARRRALAAFAGTGLDPDAGLVPPPSGSQQVQWARVVQQRDPRPGAHVYTVAAQTSAMGLVHLAVDVRKDQGGALRRSGYPALVGPPPTAPARVDPDQALRDVDDADLQATVARALRNYLAGDPYQLAADLSAGNTLSLPGQAVRMAGLDSLKWSTGGGSVVGTITGSSRAGERRTLRYELDVEQLARRWAIGAIEMRPAGP